MKCIKNNLSGEVKRLSDDRAKVLVEKGMAVYVPKSAWKAAPDTSWKKGTDPENPMKDSKKRRKEQREYRPEVNGKK